MKCVVSFAITLAACAGEPAANERDAVAMLIHSKERKQRSANVDVAELDVALSEFSEGSEDISATELTKKAAMLLRAVQPISVQFDTLPEGTKAKLQAAVRQLKTSVESAPELAALFEGREAELLNAVAEVEDAARSSPELARRVMALQSGSADSAVSGKGEVGLDGATLGKDGNCGDCQCLSPQGTGSNPTPFNKTEYIKKTWYIQKQQTNGFQPVEDLFCVTATYNETFRGDPLSLGPLGNEAPDGGYFLAFNNCHKGGTNSGTRCAEHADPAFEPGFASPLCARNYQVDVPSAIKVAPCGLPQSLSGDYWVAAAGPAQNNYEWALVVAGQTTELLDDGLCTTPDSCSGAAQTDCGLWVLTRAKVPSAEVMAAVEDAAAKQGISFQKMINIDHSDCNYDGYFIK